MVSLRPQPPSYRKDGSSSSIVVSTSSLGVVLLASPTKGVPGRGSSARWRVENCRGFLLSSLVFDWNLRLTSQNREALIFELVHERFSECSSVALERGMAQWSERSPHATLILVRCLMWVDFVVGSPLAPSFFLQVLQFSFLHKNQHLQILIRPG